MLSLLLSLIFLINKKVKEVVVIVEAEISFVIDDNEINEAADLRLKIRTFVVICFYFIKISFS